MNLLMIPTDKCSYASDSDTWLRICTVLPLSEEDFLYVVTNELDRDILVSNLISSRAIASIFGLIPLGKIWTPWSSNSVLNSTSNVLLQGWH